MKPLKSCFPLFAAVSLAQAAEPPVTFNRHIRPILAEACFQCHGPDPASREAGLRLDTEAGFFSGDDPTVVKGDPQASELYLRLTSADPDERMPPLEANKELEPEEIAQVEKWIASGAEWQPHWSLLPPELPELPEVSDSSWERNPIDRFVLAKLEERGLTPAPEADPRTLVRRLALDLTGLPPEPGVVEAFAADPSDHAWNSLVDTFLESKHYGEHRARYWLDAARYADTHGLHFDNYREMWPYRDWVVRAFNRNQPYDQFTIEQLAGDLLPEPTQDQLIATGLQRCNITTNEGGTIPEENLANYAADRVQTFGWIYLGLTTNCAQCHDHKFDPFTAKDYYALSAFFRNTTQGALDGNVKDGRGPSMVVPSPEDAERWEALPGLIEEARMTREARKEAVKPAFVAWAESLDGESADFHIPSRELVFHERLAEGPETGKLGPTSLVSAENPLAFPDAGDFEIDQPFSAGAWVRAGSDGASAGILARMDVDDAYRGWDLYRDGGSLAVHLIHAWPDSAIKMSTAGSVLEPGRWQHVFFTWDGSGKTEGIQIYVDGVRQELKVDNATLQPGQSIRTTTPFRVGQRSRGALFQGGSLQDVRIYARTLDSQEIKRLAEDGALQAILAVNADQRTPEQQEALFRHYLTTVDTGYASLEEAHRLLESEREAIRSRSPVTHIQEEKPDSEPMTPILMRGQYDREGETVKAATPEAMPPMPDGAPRNRLGLAQWLVAPEHPLMARVTVNRFWQEIFGLGLVETAEDFGIMGAPPTHPELLEWLAVTFRESGWNVKGLYKIIVNSATYRQAAMITPEKREADPDNRWLSRGPRFRMDAEMVRDYALAASGLLSPEMGGPGTKPYQPGGVWDVVGLPGGDTRNYVQDTGADLYRRTLYNFWKRMAPPPNLEAFNAPSREVCTVRRERTNTPLQALTTLNDPQFVEAARHLAQEALVEAAGDDNAALDVMARRVLLRPLSGEEREILRESVGDLAAFYGEHPDEAQALLAIGESPVPSDLAPARLAAWTMLGNQFFNLDEVLNK